MNIDRCLVTGACGFVGRHLVKTLTESGVEVVGVDDLSAGLPPADWIDSKRFQFVHQDCRRYFAETKKSFDLVVHLAAVIGGRAKIEGDPLAVGIDLSIDSSFLRWASEVKPQRILYASSSAAYPIHLQKRDNNRALRESDINFANETLGVPDQSYGWSKLTGEYLCQLAVEKYGLDVAIIRPFSGYGEDQSTSYPIPAIARRVAGRADPLEVWGSGRQARDFVYIDDIITGMLRAARTITDGSAVNLGSGEMRSFLEVAELFASLADYEPEIRTLPDKPEGVYARYANPARASDLLGWRPSINDAEGFRRVLKAQRRKIERP